ncbi:hypothetical protein ACFFX0_33465 [Citricoccus parietis]|uniref:Uncharacterized protein n=1 Tax=Citricoccus parietis TaxID=592307 RepID=A0ABV5GBD4_9MICC
MVQPGGPPGRRPARPRLVAGVGPGSLTGQMTCQASGPTPATSLGRAGRLPAARPAEPRTTHSTAPLK